ncbi:MAG: hypothetical protein ABIB55_03130 [Candidatus Nealsonbacteria bacterium]
MIEVKKVIRESGVAREVVIGIGYLEITFVLHSDGHLQEISRVNYQAQILDKDTMYILEADYRQAIKVASAILRGKTRKAL